MPAIQCHEPADGVFFAQIGPTGGNQGYASITGMYILTTYIIILHTFLIIKAVLFSSSFECTYDSRNVIVVHITIVFAFPEFKHFCNTSSQKVSFSSYFQ